MTTIKLGRGRGALGPMGLVLLAAMSGCGGDGSGPRVGRPASVSRQSVESQTAIAGAPVATPPSVVVRDADGDPVAGVTVTFAVTSGGGSVTGGTQTTNASGIATVGSWTLGTTAGTNTLTATVTGLTPATFTATGLDPCTVATTLGVPASLNGELTTIDCRLNSNHFLDRYSITLGATSAVTINLSSTAFDALEVLFDAQGNLVAFNDDRPADLNSSIRIIAAAGTYALFATSFEDGRLGAYSLSTATATGNATGCANIDDLQNLTWITAGVSTAQQLQTSDCTFGTGTSATYADRFAITLLGGRTYTITQTATYQPLLTLYDALGNPVGTYEDAAGLSRVRFTPGTEDFYVIEASSDVAGTTGSYTLSVQAGGGAASIAPRRVGSDASASALRVLTRRKAPRSDVGAPRSRRAP